MTEPNLSRRQRGMLLRSLAVQGSWNYRTLIGNGFAFALLPVLREIYRGRPGELELAVERHTELFNSHPYFAAVALGAVAKLELEAEDPATVQRFKAAVRGSLGTLGDRLVWAGWRPLCILSALLALLLGLPWWLAVAGFLGVYNAGHAALRVWGMELGLRHGKQFAAPLSSSVWVRVQARLLLTTAFLAGTIVPLVAGRAVVGVRLPWPWVVGAVVGGLAGARLGASLRSPVVAALAITALTLIVLGTAA